MRVSNHKTGLPALPRRTVMIVALFLALGQSVLSLALAGPEEHASRSIAAGLPDELLVVEPGPGVPGGDPGGQRVSVAARGADIRGVLLALVEQAGLDLIADPDVDGTITLEIENVTIGEALDAILIPAGYQYDLTAGLLRVHGRGLHTRLFTLNYMTSVRAGLTRLSASSGGSSDASATGGGDTQRSGGSGGESSFSVNSEMFSDPWTEIIKGLELILFGEVFGGMGVPEGVPERLVVHPASGVILVTASLPKLNRVADFLEKIEGSVHRQVLIEVRIMEVALSEGFHMGIDWSRIPGGSEDITSVYGNNDIAAAQKLSPGNDIFQIAASAGEFNMLLDALGTQGRVKVISSPRIATLNNQKAIIKVAREASFFSQRIDYQMQPDGSMTPIASVEPERTTIGLILDVTPQISPDSDIIMHIHPSLTHLAGEDVFPPGASGTDVLANAPVLDIREVDTVVRIKSGNMLIIGGLMKDNERLEEKGIPLLRSIPILGYLFKRTDLVKEKVELVIVLKPSVVIGEDADDHAANELERLRGAYWR
jgi:MSHA biogenesis protein MshL